MQSLNPTRIIQRQGREIMILGALVLIFGLIGCGCGILVMLFLSTDFLGISGSVYGLIVAAIAGVVLLVGLGLLIRGLTLRMENTGALAVAEILGRELDDTFTLIRNLSRRGVGYVDAVLVGPPGALVMRILDIPGQFRNEGSDWLERKAGQTYVLSRINATRECVTDVHAVRHFLAKNGLGNVPVFAVVVFTNSQVELSARQPVVPIAQLYTLPTVLRRDFLAENRVDTQSVERAVQVLYT